MLRVIVDAKVFVSAILEPASPAREVWHAWVRGDFSPVTCCDLVAEVQAGPRPPPDEEVGRMLREYSLHVEPIPASQGVAGSVSSYAYRLACAAWPDYVVTMDSYLDGDQGWAALIALDPDCNTKVYSVQGFLGVLEDARS